ncbi:hypothetical protein [Gimesia algae]|uniref:Uncharacterized protein n=1 Tax=Gimesia algae TaxID=2527971 RepID=A0A517VG72_9PLAN|nr:hypothetical protein [Gimesia algae]QDT91937.1 hypothetical protein Pan161_36010 [Gimesia algae]
MADDNFYSEENDDFLPESSAQPKQGMSTGVKVLLILLGVGGLCMLLCCGGIFWFFRNAGIQWTQNKAEIKKIQNEITDITIPDSFEPQAAMSMKILNMRMAIYEYNPKPGELFLISMGIADDGMIDMDKEFRDSMQRSNQNQRKLDIKKEEVREFDIDGEKIKFNFAVGTDKSNKEFHQVTGVFPGKQGAAFLLIQIASENYNEEEIVSMIESIKIPRMEPEAEKEPATEKEPPGETKPEIEKQSKPDSE